MEPDARQQVLNLYERMLNAWNAQDAGVFAAACADDGSVVGFDGSPMNGRSAIATTLASIFASHRTAIYVNKVREVRPRVGDVTVVRAVSED